MGKWWPRRIAEIRAVEARKTHVVIQIVVAGSQYEVLILEPEHVLDAMDEHIRHALIVEEAARHSGLTLLQALADRVHEIALELVVDVELGVTGELHCVGTPYFLEREILRQVAADEVVEEHHFVSAPRSGKVQNRPTTSEGTSRNA